MAAMTTIGSWSVVFLGCCSLLSSLIADPRDCVSVSGATSSMVGSKEVVLSITLSSCSSRMANGLLLRVVSDSDGVGLSVVYVPLNIYRAVIFTIGSLSLVW